LLELPARDDPLLAMEIRETLARLSPDHCAVLVLRETSKAWTSGRRAGCSRSHRER
jgi:hypothetical protein